VCQGEQELLRQDQMEAAAAARATLVQLGGCSSGAWGECLGVLATEEEGLIRSHVVGLLLCRLRV